MKTEWHACRRILCIRPDNIGDLLMSTPAIKALKQTFDCHITVLVSSMGAAIVEEIPEIDAAIVCDVPWVQTNKTPTPTDFTDLVQRLKDEHFDAAVIFTVYSQNPMPSILLAYLAAIPLRLAYCRENPYHLLTHWVPDEEPYSFIRHQVIRDLELVVRVGAVIRDRQFSLQIRHHLWPAIADKLRAIGVDPDAPWIVLHPEVSEQKRKYSTEDWITIGTQIREANGCQLVVTGKSNQEEAQEMVNGIGDKAFNTAGLFNLPELIVLISRAALLLSVNTGTIHIASAVQTPVLVLYALTNPQHTPWCVPSEVLYFDVPVHLQSKNEIVRYVYESFSREDLPLALPERVVETALIMLKSRNTPSGSFQQPHTLP